ncbi:MFS transporter [Nocardioides sp. 616]|uniref:MFS transporter n=1 Tax=Nocardioides sp. 616 TaxID=2268090 RepID=UPI0013B3C784|nr:MFS transporter [Nocardioides sp. 616]
MTRPRGGRRLPRSFWALWTTVLVLSIGRFVAPLLASWLASERDLGATTIGLVTATFGAGGVVASLAGGYLADRLGRLGLIVAGQVASALLLVVLAQPLGTGPLAGVLLLYGIACHLGNAALSSLVTERVEPAQRERAYSLYVWAMNAGWAVGPILASWLAGWSFAAVFYLEAALLLGVLVVLVPSLRSGSAPRPGGAPITVRTAYGELLRDRVFLVFTVTMTAYMVVYIQGTTTLPVVMDHAGFSVPQYGVLLTVNGVILCLFQLPLVRLLERVPKSTVLGCAVALTAAGYVVQVFATAWWHYAAATVLWTLGELGIFPVAATVVADIAPPRLLATYQGFYSMTWTVGRTLASLVGGLALGGLGARGLWISCVVVLLGTMWVLVVTRHDRQARERAGRAAAQGRTADVRAQRDPAEAPLSAPA